MSAGRTAAGVVAVVLLTCAPDLQAGPPSQDASRGAAASAPAPASAILPAFRVAPDAPELKASPDLVDRLRETPHRYFRFINAAFTQAVCGRFKDAGGLPDVNLHGDAHVEQYAVTSLGRGLTDFDDSARGPNVIDLVRFGVSLELASRERAWTGEGRRAFDRFLEGYDAALGDPKLEVPPPPIVLRARAAFALDHRVALGRADALIDAEPIPPSDLEADSRDYVANMLAEWAGLPASYFRIKKAGRLRMGIGSALDEKYLLRIEGWTAAADDDEILEAKVVRPLPGVDCIRTDVGAQRVPLGMALIAYAPFPFSGLFDHKGRTFWVHGWTDDYVELSIDFSFALPEDLRQVAYDVGVQLGRAHPKREDGNGIAPGLRGALRRETRENTPRIRQAIDDLADATMAAWATFRKESARP
jgi:hypothetical protein